MAAAAFIGSAIAGLPPVRDGLDRVSERAGQAWRRPRWRDVVRGVRYYRADRALAARSLTGGSEAIARARLGTVPPRVRAVYAECARRDARGAIRPLSTSYGRTEPFAAVPLR